MSVIKSAVKSVLPLLVGVVMGLLTGVVVAGLVFWKSFQNDGNIDNAEGLEIAWAWWSKVRAPLRALPGINADTGDLQAAVDKWRGVA